MTDWLLPTETPIPPALREAVGGHELVAAILARRGIDDPGAALAFLDPDRYMPAPPGDLPDLAAAAERLHEAIRRGERILVWGDFDVDGQTATALLVDGLRGLGADAIYHIPERLKHGHGVQTEILGKYLAEGIRLILTCDTGIAEHAAAQMAREAGATLLVTDHHALPPELPDADALVNPQRLPADHPLRDLPGVGVAYKLMEGLYELAGRGGEDRRLLDLAALGIVADVATQRRDTRYLLQRGINALRYPERVGLRALMRAAQVDPATLSADTIGFQVGPRLNALGRLDDARQAVELLTTADEALAEQIAARLEVLNSRRKQIEDQIYAAAQEQIARDPSLLNFDALVLESPHWHAGVIGIVAARLVEQYRRPAVLLVSKAGEPSRGSARSVPGVNIGAALAAHADLLISHGGHPGAAGLSLDPDLISQLRRQLSTTVRETRDPHAVSGIAVDGVVRLGEITMELAEDLNRLAPFGPGNPPVALMIPAVRITAHASFGVGGRHRKMTVEDNQGTMQVVTWWRGSEHPLPGEAVDMLVIPRINDYRGRRSLQLEWLDSRPLPGAEVVTGPRWEVIDLRADPDPAQIAGLDGCAVWAEAAERENLAPITAEQIITRADARKSKVLAIWTAPPGGEELAAMLEATRARTVYVLGRHAPQDTPRSFLERLAGLIKYARRAYSGEVSVARLASASAQREATVRRGLDWLAAKGQISLEWLDGDRARIGEGGAKDEGALEALEDSIRALLAESAAYRAYFRSAEVRGLVE